MVTPNQTPEAEQKKPTVTESVESLIRRKQSEKKEVTGAEVTEKMGDTSGEVADLMAGVEKPSEGVSERKGESGQKGDLKTSQGQAGDEAKQVRAQLQDYAFPPQEVMVKMVRSAIGSQIKLEWKRAKLFGKKLDKGEAEGYNSAISRVRELKQALASLLTATMDFMKNLYVKYFTPDGKRRKLDEL